MSAAGTAEGGGLISTATETVFRIGSRIRTRSMIRTAPADYSDIHEMKFNEDELDETNTRYDRYSAGGSDHDRHVQWIIFASISLGVSAFVLLVLSAILTKKSVRRNVFNLYLVFLMIPDLVFSLMCGINCSLNAARGEYVSANWCRFQVVYCVWGIGANAWLNAVIARHVHNMLRCGQAMRRYFPPTQRRVVMESIIVYLWMGFVSVWPFIDVLPHRIALSQGIACLPNAYDVTSEIFFWTVFLPCFALIPTAYVLYVAIDVWRKGMLPKSSTKRRNIAIYFFRLTIVFLVMWIPSIVLIFITSAYTTSWLGFVGGCWSHLQGAVSATASLMKQDIGGAFVEFVTCGKRRLKRTVDSNGKRASANQPLNLRNLLSRIEEPPSTEDIKDFEMRSSDDLRGWSDADSGIQSLEIDTAGAEKSTGDAEHDFEDDIEDDSGDDVGEEVQGGSEP